MTAKRTPFLLVVLGAAVAALVAAAAAPSAAPHKQRVGQRINVLLGSPAQFPAGEPFHVAHGWGGIASGSSDYDAVGKYTFVLEIDGVVRKADFVDRSVTPSSGGSADLHGLGVVHNFPDGLAGTHTFVGRWYGPCQSLVDSGLQATCANPTEVVEGLVRTLTVRFHGRLWNPGTDWRSSPDHANPSPDRYGNPDVWSYLASTTLLHDPSTYSLLPGFSDSTGVSSGTLPDSSTSSLAMSRERPQWRCTRTAAASAATRPDEAQRSAGRPDRRSGQGQRKREPPRPVRLQRTGHGQRLVDLQGRVDSRVDGSRSWWRATST